MEPFHADWFGQSNMIRSVCNRCKKELTCGGTGTTFEFETDDNYLIRFEMKNAIRTALV